MAGNFSFRTSPRAASAAGSCDGDRRVKTGSSERQSLLARFPRTGCLVFLWCLELAVCLPASAAPHEQSIIQTLYARGLRGDRAAVEDCITRLEAVLQREPQNQLARVYLGSSLTLRSRDLGFGRTKLSTLRAGLALMDEAVQAAPDDPQVRLARARTTEALPKIFGRASQSRSDFALLTQMARTQPERFTAEDLQSLRARE